MSAKGLNFNWGVVLLVGVCFLSGCGREDREAGVSPVGDEVYGIGYVEPRDGLRRLAFKHAGIVAEVLVKEGAAASTGVVIMRQRADEEAAVVALKTAEVRVAEAALARVMAGVNPARITAAEALRSEAEANVARWNGELARQRKLAAGNATTASSLEEAERRAAESVAKVAAARAEVEHLTTFARKEDRVLAEAEVAAAEAGLEIAKRRLAESELRAPCAGTVLDLIVRPGDVSDGTVCIFGDVRDLVVRAEIDERSALAIEVGQRVVVEVGGRSRELIEGEVLEVKPLMGKKTVFTRTATERKDLDVRQVLVLLPPGTRLPVGLEVDVRVSVSEMDGGRE